MTARVVIPTEDNNGLERHVAQHFGRAPFYTVVDLDDSGKSSSVKSVPNLGEHFGGVGEAHGQLLEQHGSTNACGTQTYRTRLQNEDSGQPMPFSCKMVISQHVVGRVGEQSQRLKFKI